MEDLLGDHRLLSQHGFKVKNLSGGFKTWQTVIAE